jgi:uncharacterized protein (DUF3820 family)
MPFGAHKGKPLRDVPDKYLHWLADQTWFTAESHPGLYEYVVMATEMDD